MEVRMLVLLWCAAMLRVGLSLKITDDPVETFFRNLDASTRGIGEQLRTNRIKDIDFEYDFIIVGSGSAGSVIANRLSENRDWKVLLLEIGRPENKIASVPLFAPILQWTDYNWDYRMEPQKNFCLGMKHKRCLWPRGRALGGSSVINYMIYTRGNYRDYEKWKAAGNPGWGWKDVLPYFIKSEDVHLKSYDDEYHGHGGYLSTSNVFKSEITNAFLDAGKELGGEVLDYNGKEQMGFSYAQATVKKGRRHSVAKAFLQPILNRKNLHILTEARATKIIVNPSTRQTVGIRYKHRGHDYVARVRKEVILSAGAFNSPQLLMLSGIGPKAHLEELGIPLFQDLPVGRNLQDHISYIGLDFLVNRTVESATDVFDPIKLLEWYRTGEGMASSLGGIEALGFIKTNASNEVEDYPDIELIFVGGGGLHTDRGLFNRKFIGISDAYYNKAFKPLEGIPSFTILPMLLHPKSKGHLKLKSRNPKDVPLFFGNYFSHPDDMLTLIESIKYTVSLTKTKAFAKFNARLNLVPVPDCENFRFGSDEYWSCALERFSVTLHHQVGTCKMGPRDDPEAVVNHELRVYGVGGLRVADTSVIPFSLSAHTNAPSIMVGEKAADLIKKDWL